MHIRPVTRLDLPAYGEVVARAMWDDELINIIQPYRNQYPDSNIRYCIHRATMRYYRGEDMLLAVTDPSDPDWTGKEEIMGYASYATTVKSAEKTYPSGWLGNTFERKALDLYEAYIVWFGINRSRDPVAERSFREACKSCHDYFQGHLRTVPERHKQAMGDQYWELELLGTHPNYRRRGVGKMLLQWGFERATRDQVPLFLLGSLMGEKLYLSTGFREIRRLDLRLKTGKFQTAPDHSETETEGFSWACMVWEPPNYRDDDDEEVAKS